MASGWGDQAAGLRALVGDSQPRAVGVLGGRGGSGATTVAVNLAFALARYGQRVMLLDEYSGPGNALVRLQLSPLRNLDSLLTHGGRLADLVHAGPPGVEVMPIAAHPASLAHLSASRQARLAADFDQLSSHADVLLFDARPPVGHNVPGLTLAADDVLLVITNRAESITDAYATIKLLHQEYGRREFWILVNRVATLETTRRLFKRIKEVASQYLDVKLRLMGFVPEDEKLHRANRLGQPVELAFPAAEASIAFDQLAAAMLRWPAPRQSSGQRLNVMHRLIESSRLFSDRLHVA